MTFAFYVAFHIGWKYRKLCSHNLSFCNAAIIERFSLRNTHRYILQRCDKIYSQTAFCVAISFSLVVSNFNRAPFIGNLFKKSRGLRIFPRLYRNTQTCRSCTLNRANFPRLTQFSLNLNVKSNISLTCSRWTIWLLCEFSMTNKKLDEKKIESSRTCTCITRGGSSLLRRETHKKYNSADRTKKSIPRPRHPLVIWITFENRAQSTTTTTTRYRDRERHVGKYAKVGHGCRIRKQKWCN